MNARQEVDSPLRSEPPELLVEQLALGVLPAEEARAARRRLVAAEGGEPEADARLEALRRSDDAILRMHPPERAARVIERRLADARDSSRAGARVRRWFAAPALAMAAAVALWVQAGGGAGDPAGPGALVPPGPTAPEHVGETSQPGTQPGVKPGAEEPRPTGVEETRTKGQSPRLIVHRKLAEELAEELDEGTAVSEGDVLQVSYVAAGERRGVILSIDGRGEVTLHYPEREGDSTALRREGAVPLAHAYELDDAPDFERFVFVTSEDPTLAPDVGAILESARAVAKDPARARAAALELPAGLRQQGFTVRKSAR